MRLTLVSCAVGCALALLGARDAAAQPTDQTAAPAAATQPMAMVHVDAPQEVSLQIRNDDEWETLCKAPCDKPVPAGAAFRIVGPGIRDSNTFHLDASAKTTLRVEPTSSGGHAGAIVITIIGGAALLPVAGVTASIIVGEIAGVILICPLVTAFETVKSQQSSMYGNCLGDIATYFGQAYGQPYVWIPGVVGAALLTTGIVWLIATPHSKVTQTQTQSPPSAARLLLTPPAPLSPYGTVTPSRFEAVTLPPAQVVPLVNLSF